MTFLSRVACSAMVVVALCLGPITAAQAGPREVVAQEMVRTWYRLILELVRHTATYSPPVASRSFAYVGITAYEAVAGTSDGLQSLAGQVNGLTPLPDPAAGETYDPAVVLQAAMALSVESFFSNTGPTGQRAMEKLKQQLAAKASAGVPPEVVARSEVYGRSVAAHILAWSTDDGGHVIENMGFPYEYTLTKGPANWVPTSLVVQQQKPLLPGWGNNRTFAMPDGGTCKLPPPPAYSEDPASDFYKEALEVYETKANLTPEQRAIARFWSDDPMLSPTPPGHWLSIALQVMKAQETQDLARDVDLLARMGIGLADAFIGCWNAKFEFDLLRPVTYIRRLIDPKWEAILNTPPFPEYPSGHSTQSGAAAEILTQQFGENFAFEDATHVDDALPARSYTSFWQAAEEAGISRLYGGIHFRAAIERGLDQGRCIGAYVNALKTRS